MKSRFTLLFLGNLIFAQEISVVDLFKLQLFLDYADSSLYHKKFQKDYDEFQKFYQSIDLKIRELNTNISEYSLIDNFKYYQIDMEDVICHKENTLEIGYGKCSHHILSVNIDTGAVYRLKGFNGNDFFNFIRDFEVAYREKLGKDFSLHKFIKKYKIEGIDFKCLYKARNPIFKGDCINRCSDLIYIHE